MMNDELNRRPPGRTKRSDHFIVHRSSLSVHPFSWPIRVYHEDTDSGGIVYFANYLKFL